MTYKYALRVGGILMVLAGLSRCLLQHPMRRIGDISSMISM